MNDKPERNLRRIKPRRRNRATPMFDQPKVEPAGQQDLVKEPESNMDVARLLADEIKKKWSDAQTPASLSGKHSRFAREIVNEFSGEVVRSMIRLLVWDFEEIKKNKAFFPPSAHLNWPWMDQLYHYRHALASAVGTGITDSTSRSSAYAQRYLNQTEKPQGTSDEAKQPQGDSMKDIAKRLLGQ